MDESLIKLSKVPDRVPTVNDISGFKFAWNTRDGKMFGLKDNGDGTFSVVPVGSGGLAEAETDPVFQAWLSTFVAAVEKSYLSLTDTPDSYAGKAKNIPIVKDAENGLDFMGTVLAKLTHLADFPAAYTGQSLKLVRVKADESGVEFYAPTFISGITKADIEAVLTGAITSHTHADNEVNLELDFLDLTAYVYNCPVAMKFVTQDSEGTDATLSIALNTDMIQFQKLTITPTQLGLIVLKGVKL